MAAPLLEGVRVLSVGHTLPAMYCIPALVDLGADVTLVEPLLTAEAAGRYAQLAGLFPTRSLLAGTSRCRINLKDRRGEAVYLRLAKRSDVVLDGFRPGTTTRLGIGYDAVQQANPQVIYAAISGYGQEGPAHQRVGHDLNYLAEAGVLELTGHPGATPAIPGVPVADGLTGLNAALNLVAALWQRSKTVRGCFLDLAIIDSPLFLMAMELDFFRQTGHARRRGDTHLSGGYAWYQVFETKDGRHLSVAAVEPHFYKRLCELVGRPDLVERQFGDGAERDALRQVFGRIFRARTSAEWLQLLENEDVCVALVRDTADAASGAHLRRLQCEAEDGGAPLVRSPVRLPRAPLAAPRDTAASLAHYGFAAEEIRALEAAGCIAAA